MGCQTAASDLLGAVGDHVALLDRAGNRRRNRDEPVAGIERRCHAPGLDVAQQYRLAEHRP
jgi:hypothetical protein